MARSQPLATLIVDWSAATAQFERFLLFDRRAGRWRYGIALRTQAEDADREIAHLLVSMRRNAYLDDLDARRDYRWEGSGRLAFRDHGDRAMYRMFLGA